MHKYRVTKYDPSYRDSAGAYTRTEWTSYSDIGRAFDRIVLEPEEYLRVEQQYIDTAVGFLREDGIDALRISGLENSKATSSIPLEGSRISISDSSDLFRAILREAFWCRFECDGGFVHFGYDYYMYLGLRTECPTSVALASTNGLFVDKFRSPYLESNE